MQDEAMTELIDKFNGQIRELEQQAKKKKLLVNHLCEELGHAPMYGPEEVGDSAAPKGKVTVEPGEFFTKPLATVVRTILEKRKAAGLPGPAKIDDIYPDMIAGGYVFEAKSAGTAKRALSIALAKNSTTFVRLPAGEIALTSWFPNLPKPKAAKDEAKKSQAKDADPEDDTLAFTKAFDDGEVATETPVAK